MPESLGITIPLYREKIISHEQQTLNNASYITSHRKKDRINIGDFKKIIPPEKINKNLNYVNEKKRIFREIDQQRPDHDKNLKYKADAMEEIVGDRAEDFHWYDGKNIKSELIPTSEYDDFYNGIDSVIVFQNENKINRLALSIDTTMGMNYQYILHKITTNTQKFLDNKMQVTYFKSDIDNFKGTLKNCIPVVVGLDNITSEKLINDVAELARLEDKKDKTPSDLNLIKEKKEKLCNDPSQILIIEEIKIQLEKYKNTIQKENIKTNSEKLNTLLEIINEILEEKKDLVNNPQTQELRKKDKTYQTIINISKI